jgi:type IV pilus assembly protein PilO
MKIGPREQIILAIVGVVLVVVAIVAFLIWPQIQQLGKLDSEIAAARGDVASAQALLQTVEQSKARASETDAKWLRLANLVPDGPDLPSLIIELQDAAFDSGVQLLGVTPSTPVAQSSYHSIPIQLDVIGTWSDTVDYLQRLVKLNRGIRIVESSSTRTNNSDVAAKENQPIPEYSERTVIKIEAYMIPSAAVLSTPTAPPAGN